MQTFVSSWRRSALVLAVVLIAAPFVAIPTAGATLPTPPDPQVQWGVCTSPSDTYCIESATADGADILPGGAGSMVDGFALDVQAYLLDAHSVNFAVQWSHDNQVLPVSMEGQDLKLVLRTGAVQPLFTTAIADRYYMLPAGNDTDGYSVTIEGTATTFNWKFGDGDTCQVGACGDDTTFADTFARAFSGNTQDMTNWDPGERAQFGGMYIATNAQYKSTVVQYSAFPDPHWYLDIGNPHLAIDALTATSGSFTAWVPPSYFTGIGTTAEAAVAEGFSVDRDDSGVTTSIPGAASLVDGGAYLRIPDIHYSTPTISVFGLQNGDVRAAFAPDPPLLGTATPGANRVTAHVTAPIFDGGSPITTMSLRCVQGTRGRVATGPASATLLTVTGLLSNAPATCTLKAINAAGTTAGSHDVTVTPSGATLPGVPTGLHASAVGRVVNIGWAAPATPGSSPVLGYRVQVCKPVGCVGAGIVRTRTLAGTSTHFTLTGFPAGNYVVKVAAGNTSGLGNTARVVVALH